MRGRVLVTRPEPEASRMARRLAEAGFRPILLPLTEIRPLPVRAIVDAGPVDAVAATSVNAIRHAAPALLSPLAAKPMFAVGKRTARFAREAGFKQVFEGDGDAVRLADRVAAELAPGSRVLYVCGKVRRPEFEAALRDRGLELLALETYDTVEVSASTGEVATVLGNKPVESAILLSANAAGLLSSLAEAPALAAFFRATRYFCMSRRVADALTGVASSRILVSETPDEDALLALLERES